MRSGCRLDLALAAITVALAILTPSALALAVQGVPQEASSPPKYDGFIRAVNGRFVDSNCQEFPVTGMNTWMMMEAAAGLTIIPCTIPDGLDPVQYTFQTAAANSFTVVRSFAHGVNNTLPLQTSAGVYNETAFVALDYILTTAAANGVKLLFTMGDNWQYADAKRNYNGWAGFDDLSDEFWTNNVTRQMYKDHIKAMVNRVNSISGVRYGDDPTIFAWNLMNEPRCDCFPEVLPYPADFSQLPPGCAPSCIDSITAWIAEMSSYLKSVDPNHLVTVGEEGFWGYYDTAYIQYNPENSVSPWAALTGNNFTAQHRFVSIDFAAVHYWPDQWTPKATSAEPFFTPWMAQHSTLTAALGKPLILEELGKTTIANATSDALNESILSVRQPFMELVYGQFNQSLQTGGAWRGTLFWMWGFCPVNTNDNNLQIAAGDADFQNVISPAAANAKLLAANGSPLELCVQVPVNASAPAEAAAPATLIASPALPIQSTQTSTLGGAASTPPLSGIAALQTAGR